MQPCGNVQTRPGILATVQGSGVPIMLKLSLIVMFVLSLATLSFASSLIPSPGEGTPVIAAEALN